MIAQHGFICHGRKGMRLQVQEKGLASSFFAEASSADRQKGFWDLVLADSCDVAQSPCDVAPSPCSRTPQAGSASSSSSLFSNLFLLFSSFSSSSPPLPPSSHPPPSKLSV